MAGVRCVPLPSRLSLTAVRTLLGDEYSRVSSDELGSSRVISGHLAVSCWPDSNSQRQMAHSERALESAAAPLSSKGKERSCEISAAVNRGT